MYVVVEGRPRRRGRAVAFLVDTSLLNDDVGFCMWWLKDVLDVEEELSHPWWTLPC